MSVSVVDASVAVKWFLDEVGSPSARTLAASGEILIAPSLIRLEIHHVLWRASRKKRISRADAEAADANIEAFLDTMFPIDGLAEAARALSWRLSHPVYDCLYICLALREKATFWTADDRQFEAARKAGLAPKHILTPPHRAP